MADKYNRGNPFISDYPVPENLSLQKWVEEENPEDLKDVARIWRATEPDSLDAGRVLDALETVHYMIDKRIQELENKIEEWREQQSYSGTSKTQDGLSEKIVKAEARIDELQGLLVYADEGGNPE